MSETTTKPEVITGWHIAEINHARDALAEIVEAADRAAWYAPTNAAIDSVPYAQWYGKLSALAEAAADSLFDVLNTAAACRIADITDEDMFNRPEDGPEPDGQRMEGGRIVPTDR